MAPRAFWTGHLRLSLVTIPVRLYPATSSERRIELHQIHEPSGQRIRYQKVAPGVGPVETEEITKGYEYEKGKYVLDDPKEVDELKLESKQTIDMVRFVDEDAIELSPTTSRTSEPRLSTATIITGWSRSAQVSREELPTTVYTAPW